jgi:hypothetical protein
VYLVLEPVRQQHEDELELGRFEEGKFELEGTRVLSRAGAGPPT